MGATLGREFHYELLQAVSPLDEDTLQQGLQQLVEAELVYQSGVRRRRAILQACPDSGHGLSVVTQEPPPAVTSADCPGIGGAVSRDRRDPTRIAGPSLHRGGLIAQAIPYWQQAGQRASQRSANVEAISHLTKGLELLKTLPDTPERTQQELTLQIALGVPLMATKGYAAPEVEQAYTRARELCQQVGETPQLFPVLMGLWVFYIVRAEYQTARELAEQLLTPGPERPRPCAPPGGPLCAGRHLVLSGRVRLCPSTLGAGRLPSTTPSSTAPMPSSTDMTPGWIASPTAA